LVDPGGARLMTSDIVKCVLLADRHHGLAEGLRGLLETAFEAVVMVADEASLMESARRLQPDLAVVDLSLSRADNLNWLCRLRALCPELKLVLLSVYDEPSVRQAVLKAGADAFVLKRSAATDLLPAIEAVMAGRPWNPLSPREHSPEKGGVSE
jgi:two-component system secretion response regulator SsrB